MPPLVIFARAGDAVSEPRVERPQATHTERRISQERPSPGADKQRKPV